MLQRIQPKSYSVMQILYPLNSFILALGCAIKTNVSTHSPIANTHETHKINQERRGTKCFHSFATQKDLLLSTFQTLSPLSLRSRSFILYSPDSWKNVPNNEKLGCGVQQGSCHAEANCWNISSRFIIYLSICLFILPSSLLACASERYWLMLAGIFDLFRGRKFQGEEYWTSGYLCA